MGNSIFGNELLKRSNVKLQAQQVSAYDGSSIKWHSWNKKMKAAVGTAGMLRVLEEESYARSHPIDNETVFHLLQVATADGHAAHLVDAYEEMKDGYSAYQELVKWYEGDELTTKTAEDVRAKLDKLKLSNMNTASQYINQFLQHTKHLAELKEEYTPSKTVNIFLTQITDPDYTATVEHCLENKLKIRECIEKIRAKERRLDRSRSAKRRTPIIVRRYREDENNHNIGKEFSLEDYKTKKGFYSVPSEIWFNLTEEERLFIKEQNGKVRRNREDGTSGEESPKKRARTNVRSRRTKADEKEENGEKEESKDHIRTVQFQEENNKTNGLGQDNSEEKRVIQRRGALRFRIRGEEE